MLVMVPDTSPAGLGEPLNIILSANSDAAVMVDQLTDGGLQNYFQSIGFSTECFGVSDTTEETGNLGDGNGYQNQTGVIRWDYADPNLGTCKESEDGGNHFRYYVQNGSQANSGAIFMATSYELPIAQDHDIIPNGYNLGRDQLVGNATNTSVPTSSLSTSSTFSGTTSNQGYTYQTSVTYVSGLLNATSDGINHYLTVAVDGQPAIDGLVAVMVVKMTGKPNNSASSNKSGASTLHLPRILTLGVLLAIPLLGIALL